MRTWALAVFLVALFTGAGDRHLLAQNERVTAVLAATRAALGGEDRIKGVRTFVATGRTRQLRGDNLVPIEFEMQAELPDRYSRHEEVPAQDTPPTTLGFDGDALIQIPPAAAPAARRGGPGPPQPALTPQERVNGLKQDFARLMLGMFAVGPAGVTLTFTDGGEAESPQGKAHVINVAGLGATPTRLFLDAQTNLPLMVSWQAAPAGAREAAPPLETAAVEQRLFFADYRTVDGLRLPFRIRRAVAADTVEETTFDRFRINVKIDPRRFGPRN